MLGRMIPAALSLVLMASQPPIDWDTVSRNNDITVAQAATRADQRFEARLTEYRERLTRILAEGRRAFEAQHKAEIEALTLTPAELADIKPRKR